MVTALNVNPPAAKRLSAAAPEPSIAPRCQCARAVLRFRGYGYRWGSGRIGWVVGAWVWRVENLWLRGRLGWGGRRRGEDLDETSGAGRRVDCSGLACRCS